MVGVGVLAASSSGSATTAAPKPRPSAGTPPEVLARIVAALATNDPKKMRAEAAKLRREGWDREAAQLEKAATETENAGSEDEHNAPGPTGAPDPVGPTGSTGTVYTPPAPPASGPTGPRVLSEGMRGDDVKVWQRQLIADGYSNIADDGIFGPLTTAATRVWQAERGLKVDGIVGPATRGAIGMAPIASVEGAPGTGMPLPGTSTMATTSTSPGIAATPTPPKPPAQATPTTAAKGAEPRLLSEGSKGDDVKAWQTQLVDDGYSTVKVDGIFGPVTTSSTKIWQVERGIKGDGIVGPATRAAIGKSPVMTVPGSPRFAAMQAAAAAKKENAPPAAKPPTVATPAAPKPPVSAAPTNTGKPPAPAEPKPSTEPRLLKEGLQGDDVGLWQSQLIKDGYVVTVDRIFGPKTTQATKAWQTDRGLKADGIVGPATRAAIGKAVPKKTPAQPAATASSSTLSVDTATWRVLKEGLQGQDVKEWQLVLNKYGFAVATDGIFGPKTTAATKAFQTKYKLTSDGIVGNGTKSKLKELSSSSTALVAGDLEHVGDQVEVPPLVLMLSPDELLSEMAQPLPSNDLGEDLSPEQLAHALVAHLSTAPAGQEDRSLVARFQRANGLNDTGAYGPATAEAIAALGLVPPRPFHWPSKKSWRAKSRYRIALRERARLDPDRRDEWLHASNV
ncbi:MAG: peptidoglycan-binding protein [Polyangiaceae bacterium]